MAIYIHQLSSWPRFYWDFEGIAPLLAEVRHEQGRLLGRMDKIGFNLQADATLQTISADVVRSSEIEGELLDAGQVRSSVARKMGLDIGGLVQSDRQVDGIVEMMLDATQNFLQPLSADRLFAWHSLLFPAGRSGLHKIVTGRWRDNNPSDPMQVVSGPMGRQTIHFEAPRSELIEDEMQMFIGWFNSDIEPDTVLKAAIAHLWFITIHPFDDGNGRIARAVTDMLLARADGASQRFYSMSSQIRKERNRYYSILEETQKGNLDITAWLMWFLQCLRTAIVSSDELLGKTMQKAQFWSKHGQQLFNDRQRLLLNKLLDHFEGKLTSSKWAKLAKCSQDTALRDIQDLVNKQVLEKENSGGRSTSYRIVGYLV